MLKDFFEQATIIYYKYFTKTYIGGTHYRTQELNERISLDKNGYTY